MAVYTPPYFLTRDNHGVERWVSAGEDGDAWQHVEVPGDVAAALRREGFDNGREAGWAECEDRHAPGVAFALGGAAGFLLGVVTAGWVLL